LLLTALAAASAWAYPRLPETIPVHFGPTGAPDRWANSGMVNWFVPVLVATTIVALVEVCAWMIERNPRRINTPDAQRFRALPDDAQAEVAGVGTSLLRWIGVLLVVLFAAIQWSVWNTARGGLSGKEVLLLAVGGVLIGVPAMAIRTVIRTRRLIDQLYREHAGSNRTLVRRPAGQG
jgi:uncharacterized membrane protein